MKKIFLFLIMLTVLVSLAIWQVIRSNYKVSLINQIQSNKNLEAIHFDNALQLEDSKYRKIKLSGKLIKDKTIFYYRLKNNVPGFEVITPVSFDNNIILLSRGWLKEKEELRNFENTITIEGYLIDLYKQNIVSPNNRWDKKEVFSLNIEDIQNNIGIKPLPYILILNSPDELKIGDQDLGFDIFNLQNKHLGYAITWGGLAIILIVIFIIDLKKQRVK